MAGLGTGTPIVKVYHEKSMILPDVSRVLACLYEKDINFETHTASYKSLLRLQASSHAPVPFYDGPKFLEDSREICRYIAETYEHGYQFLLGKDALERASIEQWLHHEEHAFNPPSRALFCHLAFPLDEEDEDIEMQKTKLKEVLEVYDQRLSDSKFLAGDRFTLADLVHLPNSHHITASDDFVYLYDSRKNVQRWWNDISSRNSWKKVLRDMARVEERHKLEEQHKLEELEKQKQQQQQWQREHRSPTGRRTRLDTLKRTSTKPHTTILVPPPAGTVSTSPAAPQAEQPHPIYSLSDKAPVSSSQTTTTHKSSTVESKQTTFFPAHPETPSSIQSTPSNTQITSTSFISSPGTFPAAPDKLSGTDAGKPSIRDASVPSDTTETDLPTKPEISDEDAQAKWFRAAYDDAQDTTQRSRKNASLPRQERDQDKHDTTEGTRTYDSAPSRSQPIDASDDSLPSKKAMSESPHRATPIPIGYQGAQEFIQQSRERPKPRPAPYDSQGSTGEVAESPPSKAQLLGSRGVDVSSPKEVLNEDGYDIVAQSQRGCMDGRDNWKQARDTTTSRPMMTQETFEETKMADSASFKARTLDSQKSIPQKQPPTEDPQFTASTLKKRYFDDQDSTKKSKHTASGPRQIEAQDSFEETNGGESALPRELPSDILRAATLSSRQAEAKYVRNPTPSSQEGYEVAQADSKQPGDPGSIPRRIIAQDARVTFVESKATDSTSTREQPSDPWQVEGEEGPLPGRRVYDVHSTTSTFQETTSKSEDITAMPQKMAGQDAEDTSEETKFSDSASPQVQPFHYQRSDSHLQKQEGIEYPRSTISPLEKSYADVEDTTKHPGDTYFKPREMLDKDAQDGSKETKALDSAIFRGRPQPHDTPSKQAEGKDALEVNPFSPTRHPTIEDTSRQPRRTASTPREKAVQDARDAFRESKSVDSTSSREQPSDVRPAAASLPKQETADARNTTMPFRRRYPDTEGTTKEAEDINGLPRQMGDRDAKDSFETKIVDSASTRHQLLGPWRTDPSSQKQEAMEDPHGSISQSVKRLSDIEDTTKQPRDTALEPRKMVGQDAQDTSQETKPNDSILFMVQPSDTSRAAITPSQKATAKDARSVYPPSPTRYPSVEDNNKKPRGTTPPTWKAPQDSRDVFRESEAVDSTSSHGQHSDSLQDSASLPKQEVDDPHKTTTPFQKKDPGLENTIKPIKDTIPMSWDATAQDTEGTFKETKIPDSTAYSMPELNSPRADSPSWKQEPDPRHATLPLKRRHSDTEDTTGQARDAALEPRPMVGKDAQVTFEETKAVDATLLREQSSDTWQGITTPAGQIGTHDGLNVAPSRKEFTSDEDSSKQPRGTASTPNRIAVQDANGTFKYSKPTNSVSSRPQLLNASGLAVPPPREEVKDSPSIITPLKKISPEDSTKKAGHSGSAPTHIAEEDDKHTFEHTMFDDSASSSKKPADGQQAVLPLSKQAEVQVTWDENRQSRDTWDKGKQSRETISAPKKMVSGDAQDTSGERKTTDFTSREQSTDHLEGSSQSRQDAPDDARGSTKGAKVSFIDETIQSPDVKDSTRESRTSEEIKDPVSTFDITQSFGFHDTQHANAESRTLAADQRKNVSTEFQSDDQYVHKEFTSPFTDQRGKVSPPSQEEYGIDAQATRERTFSTERLREMLKESEATTPEAPPADSQGPVAVEKIPSVYQKNSAVSQDNHGLSTTDQMPTSMSQEAIPSGQVANEITKRSAKQIAEPPAPLAQQTSDDVQHALPSFPGAGTAERAHNMGSLATSTPTKRAIPDPRDIGDQEFVNISTAVPASSLESQLGGTLAAEVVQAEQKSTLSEQESARATQHLSPVEPRKEVTNVSVADQTKAPQKISRQQTKPSAPITREVSTSYNQGVISKIQEVSPDNHPTDYLVVPPIPTQEQVSHAPQRIPGREGITPVPGKMDSPVSDAQLASENFQEPAPDDQGSHVKSSFEPHGEPTPDIYGSVADKETIKPISRKELSLKSSSDSTPTHGYIGPTSGDGSAILLDQGAQSFAATQQPTHPDALGSASTQDVPDDSLVSPKKLGPHSTDQEAISFVPNQTSIVGTQPDTALGEVARVQQKLELSDQDLVHSSQETVLSATEQTKALPKTIGQQETPGMRKPPTSDTQNAPRIIPSQETPDVPNQEKLFRAEHAFEAPEGPTPHADDSITDEKKIRPLPSLTKIPDAVVDLTHASGTTSSSELPRRPLRVQGAQTPSATQTSPPFVSHETVPTEDIPFDTSGKVKSMRPSASPDAPHGEVALSEQKLTSADRYSSPSTQLSSSGKPRNEEINDSDHSTELFSSAAPGQDKDLQTTIGQQEISPATGTSKPPSTDVSDVRKANPDYQSIDNSISSSQEQDTRTELASKIHEGPTETPGPAPLLDVHDSISPQDIPDGDLNKARSSSADQEAKMPRTLSASAAHNQYGSTPDEVAPAKHKIALEDQDSANSAQKSSSREPKEEESTVATPDQTKASQTIIGQQDISPPEDHSIDGSIPSQEQVPNVKHHSEPREGPFSDSHGSIVEEAKAHITTGTTSALDTQHSLASGEVSPDQDSDHYSELPSSAKSRKEETYVVSADETKAKEMTFGHQITQPASTPSEASREVQEVGEDTGHSHDHEKQPLAAYPSSLPPEKLPDSMPAKKLSADAFDKVERLKPANETAVSEHKITPEPISSVGPRKEVAIADEVEQTKPPQKNKGHQEIQHAPAISEERVLSNSQENTGTPTEEKPREQQQTEQSSTKSSIDEQDANGVSSNMLEAQTYIQPPLPKGSMEATEEYRSQQKAYESTTIPSPQGKQEPTEETEGRGTGTDGPGKTDLHGNINQMNNATSQEEAQDQSGKEASGVQQAVSNKSDVPKSTKDMSSGRQAYDKPGNSLVTSEEYGRQPQTEGNVEGPPANFESPRPPSAGETVMAPTTSQEPTPDAPHGTTPSKPVSTEETFTPLDGVSISAQMRPPIESSEKALNIATGDQTAVSQESAVQDTIESSEGPIEPSSDDRTNPSLEIRESTPNAPKPLPPMTDADGVRTRREDSLDLSGDEKGIMPQDGKESSQPNATLSANQAVGQSENSAGTGALSEERVLSNSQENTGTRTEEKPREQQKTEQSSTKSSIDEKDANGVSSNMLEAQTYIQPPLPKGSMETTEEDRSQQKDYESTTVPSPQGKQEPAEETEARGTGTDGPGKTDLHGNINQMNNGTSQEEAQDQSGKEASGVQQEVSNKNDVPKSTKDISRGIQAYDKPGNSLVTSEEYRRQPQTEGNVEGPPANFESPRPPSAGETVVAPTASQEPTPDAPQDGVSISAQTHPPIESIEKASNIATDDQTAVSQESAVQDTIASSEGPIEPSSDDRTNPSFEIQESTPNAPKRLPPMTDADGVRTRREDSLDLSGDEKGIMPQDGQESNQPNATLSANQAVGRSENSAGTGALSEERVLSNSQESTGTPTEEKPKEQQQTEQSSTESSIDEKVANGVSSNMLEAPTYIQPPLPKGSMEATEEDRSQQKAYEATTAPSPQDKQEPPEETEAQGTGTDGPGKTDLHGNINQMNNGTSQDEAQEQPDKEASGVQQEVSNKDDVPKSTKDTSSGIQAYDKPGNSLVASEEYRWQPQTNGNVEGPPANFESQRPPSAGETVVAPTTSQEPTPDAPQDGVSISAKTRPPIESSEKVLNIATGYQTAVSQEYAVQDTIASSEGPIEPSSDDPTNPSLEIRESTPNAPKPFPPMSDADGVRTRREDSLDLSGDEKGIMPQDGQESSQPNATLSANQAVGQSENIAGTGALSEERVLSNSQENTGTPTEEKPREQQQTEQSSTKSSIDEKDANGVSSNILEAQTFVQPPLPKGSMEATEEDRSQQKAYESTTVPSPQGKQEPAEETEARGTGADRPGKTDLHGNINQMNNGTSQEEAQDQSGKEASGVQQEISNKNDVPNSTKGTSSGIQAYDKPGNSLVTSEEYRRQPQTEGNVEGPPANFESQRPPSAGETVVAPTTSQEPTPDAPQDGVSISAQTRPPIESSEKGPNIATGDQTAVPQESAVQDTIASSEGPIEQSSDDRTNPSLELRESTPNAPKPLPPMTDVDGVRTRREDSVDLSSDENGFMSQDGQESNQPNATLSANQAVSQSENSAGTGALSEERVLSNSQENTGTPTEEKPREQQQTEQSSTKSSIDEKDANGVSSNMLEAPAYIQPPLPKGSMEATEEDRSQQKAYEATTAPSPQGKQEPAEETVAQGTGTDGPGKTDLHGNINQMDNGTSQEEAQNQSGKEASGVQQEVSNKNDVPKESTPNAPKRLPPMIVTDADGVRTRREDSLDLSSNEKGIMPQDGQESNQPNATLSANQAVGRSENSAGTGALSEERVLSNSQENTGTPTEEKPREQQQTEQSSTKSTIDEKDVNGISSNMLEAPAYIQPPLPKGSMEATEEDSSQQKAYESTIVPSPQGKQEPTEETEARGTGTDGPGKTDLHENINQMNNGTSQEEAQDQSGKEASGVQQEVSNKNDVPKSTKDMSSGIQAYDKPKGEVMDLPALETKQTKERDLLPSNRSMSSQLPAQASDISDERPSSGFKKIDGLSNDSRPDDAEDVPSP
ncbi:hypothetical protein GUJ93_ZPchr0009g1751 [Zizania palustris]|uniref:glutathione transferase n=1 Tax=Zizania palustris TaxID=103762 RepID=A0A8J5RJH3_ZIZPA|nr:hypothetical protein GUJ93_ZPchr0009g1751 [Zizania palustris]